MPPLRPLPLLHIFVVLMALPQQSLGSRAARARATKAMPIRAAAPNGSPQRAGQHPQTQLHLRTVKPGPFHEKPAKAPNSVPLKKDPPSKSRAEKAHIKSVKQRLRSERKEHQKSDSKGHLLDSPSAALSARLAAIDGAKREIQFSTFILANDSVARLLFAKLADAAKRGVRTRLLYDAMGSKPDPEALRFLLDAGVEVGVYNKPQLLQLGELTHRMHDKLVIVDGQEMVHGGRNTEAGYFGIRGGAGKIQFGDVDMYVRGKSASVASKYYDRLWGSPQVQRVRPSDLGSPKDAQRTAESSFHRGMAIARRILDSQYGKRFLHRWRERESSVLQSQVFLHEDTGLSNPSQRIRGKMTKMLAEATKEVEFVNPYVLPDRTLIKAVEDAVKRGVVVRFVTNSMTSNDQLVPALAYEGHFPSLAKVGAEIWENVGPTSIHAKTAVVDGRRVFIGSHNLDPRSARLNKEVGVLAESQVVAKELQDANRRFRQKSVLVAKGGKILPTKNQSCGPGCRFFASRVFAPIASFLGVLDQL